jgi:hypothetical protein
MLERKVAGFPSVFLVGELVISTSFGFLLSAAIACVNSQCHQIQYWWAEISNFVDHT